jgi:hypothetical protein
VTDRAPYDAWKTGPRVRVDALRRGQRFLSIDGKLFAYERVDGASPGVHHVVADGGERTAFAACAEVVLVH